MSNGSLLYLAPMRGLTDAVFRRVHAEVIGGFDRAIAPFFKTVSGGLPSNADRELGLEHNREMPVVPQLLGRDAADFLAAAKQLQAMGHGEVNWNLGCPHRMVTKKKMGAGLLGLPKEVDRFLEQVFASIEIAVSIKVRLGMEDPGELSSLMAVFNQYPIAELIIHPRTADQMYEGPVRLDSLEECAGLTEHRLVYSGDIFACDGYRVVTNRFPKMAGWMLGRGVLEDPFLPLRIRYDSEKLDVEEVPRLRIFHDELYRGYKERLSGPGHVLARMQGLWEYMGPGSGFHKRFVKKIKKAYGLDQYDAAVNQMFDSRR